MLKALVAGSLALAGIAAASPAKAYWYPAPYYYGYRPHPIYFAPPVLPVVPYYRPRVVYVPPPAYPAQVYVAPVYRAPIVRRPVRVVRSTPRPAPAPQPPCACVLPDSSPFTGPGQSEGVSRVSTRVGAQPAPLPTLGAPTLPNPARAPVVQPAVPDMTPPDDRPYRSD